MEGSEGEETRAQAEQRTSPLVSEKIIPSFPQCSSFLAKLSASFLLGGLGGFFRMEPDPEMELWLQLEAVEM